MKFKHNNKLPFSYCIYILKCKQMLRSKVNIPCLHLEVNYILLLAEHDFAVSSHCIMTVQIVIAGHDLLYPVIVL